MTAPNIPSSPPLFRTLPIATDEVLRTEHLRGLAASDVYRFAHPRSSWTWGENITVASSRTLLSDAPFHVCTPTIASRTLTVTMQAEDITITVNGVSGSCTGLDVISFTVPATAVPFLLDVAVAPRAGITPNQVIGIYIRETRLESAQLP